MKSKKIALLVTLFATSLLFALAACGVEGDDLPDPPVCEDCDPVDPDPVCGDDVCDSGEDAQSCPDDCKTVTPTPTYGVCPFKTDGAYNFNVAGTYISGATKGEVRFFTEFSDGSYPNPQVLDSNASGYLGMQYTLDEGTYRFSYLGYQYSSSCSGSDCPVAWAQYGGKNVLSTLSPECLAFVDCNWWDATAKAEKNVECAECALKITVADDGTITGAGNMANFSE